MCNIVETLRRGESIELKSSGSCHAMGNGVEQNPSPRQVSSRYPRSCAGYVWLQERKERVLAKPQLCWCSRFSPLSMQSPPGNSCTAVLVIPTTRRQRARCQIAIIKQQASNTTVAPMAVVQVMQKRRYASAVLASAQHRARELCPNNVEPARPPRVSAQEPRQHERESHGSGCPGRLECGVKNANRYKPNDRMMTCFCCQTDDT